MYNDVVLAMQYSDAAFMMRFRTKTKQRERERERGERGENGIGWKKVNKLTGLSCGLLLKGSYFKGVNYHEL